MYQLIKQKRKTISIQINEALQVVVKAPYYVSQSEIDVFVKRHEQWIKEAQSAKKETLEELNWWYTRQIFYEGLCTKIQFRTDQQEKVTLEEGSIVISLKDINDEKQATQLLTQWLTERTRVVMTEMSDNYCKLLGCDYNKIYIRKQRTRWGSCSSKGNLSYNSRLICAPRMCMAYVALHEVMHLKYFDHGKSFWYAIETVMPEYKKYQDLLKQQGKHYNF